MRLESITSKKLDQYDLRDGDYIYDKDKKQYYLKLKLKKHTDILFVILTNCCNESRKRIIFDREDWHKVFPGSMLHVSNLAVDSENNKINVGWDESMQGEDFINDIRDIVLSVINKLKAKTERVCIYGYGNAGIGAIRLALRIPGASSCCIICDNRRDKTENSAITKLKIFFKHESNINLKKLIKELNVFPSSKISIGQYSSGMSETNLGEKLNKCNKEGKHIIQFYNYCHEQTSEYESKEDARKIISMSLNLANIQHIKEKIEKIPSYKLYLVESNINNIRPDKIIFKAAGRIELDSVEMTVPFNWNSNPYNDNNWVAQVQMWRMIDDYIIKYERTNDIIWLIEPIKIIEDWFDYYEENKPIKYVWSDMTTGLRAMKLSYILSLYYANLINLSSQFIEKCKLMIDKHINFLLNDKHYYYSNHTFIVILAAISIAQVVTPIRSNYILNFTEIRLKKLIKKQFYDDGLHRENSPAYHSFGIAFLEKIKRTQWFSDLCIDELVKKAKKIKEWLYLPDGRYAPIGDTDGLPSINIDVKTPYTTNQEILQKGGYAIIKKGDNNSSTNHSYLFFSGGYSSRIHKHSDDLSLLWYEGQDILCDVGKYAYQNSEKRDYAISTRAHNTLEIDNDDTYKHKDDGLNTKYDNFIRSVDKVHDIFIINSKMIIKRFCVSHIRYVIFKPASFLIAIDDINARNKHKYSINWHFDPKLIFSPLSYTSYSTTLLNNKKLYVNGVTSDHLLSNFNIGSKEPRIQGFISTGYRKLIPSPCISFYKIANNTTIISSFSIGSYHSIYVVKKSYYMFYGVDCYKFTFLKDALQIETY